MNTDRLKSYVKQLVLFPKVAGKDKKGLVNDSKEVPKELK